MSVPDYQPIEKFLKTLPYLSVRSHIKNWFGGRVVGWNVKASSCIRKRFTIERLQDEIDKNELPLTLHDEFGDHHDTFRVLLNLND